MDGLTDYVRTIRPHKRRDFDAVDHGIEGSRRVGLRADRVDAGVRPAAVRHVLTLVVDVVFLEIQRLGPGRSRHLKALRYRVDRDSALGTEQEGGPDRHLSDRAAAPDRDRIAALDIAEVG